MKPLTLMQHFVPYTNAMQLLSFFFFWANITAISFVPEVDWGISKKAFETFWHVVRKFFLLTLFDFNLTFPNLPWVPDLFRSQFAIAVVVLIAFPFGAVKYHRFLKEYRKSQSAHPRHQSQHNSTVQRRKKSWIPPAKTWS